MDERIIAVDLYNQVLTGEVCMTLRQKAADSDHIPCVVIKREPIAFTTEMTPKVGGGHTISNYKEKSKWKRKQ